LQALHREHLRHALAQAAGGRFVFLLQESRQLFQPLYALFGIGDPPSRPHQVQRLRLLFLRHHIPHLMVAAPLHRLVRTKHFVNGSAQRFCTVDDKQVLTVGWQPWSRKWVSSCFTAAAFSVAPT
jgi:hypothetical protein